MLYKVVYRLNARINVKEAKAWYKQQQDGLQKDFANSVKEAILRVQTQPEAFAIRYKNVRIAHPYKFPFSIHFYIDVVQQQIVVTNIVHDKMDFNIK